MSDAAQEDKEPEADRAAIEDAYAAGFQAGEIAERNRCRWPECTNTADMICERFTVGTCAGPSTEFMP